MKQTYFLFFIIISILIFCDCANPLTPEGGPRDKMSPQVDSTQSTPFSATNFDEKRIVIGFNEWVRLKNANQQIIISPPLEKQPEIRVRGKSVIIEFKEKLRPNTTYTVNFGDAVEDITEGNKALALNYTFSTGDYIDSLEIRGRVRDAATRKTQEDVYVMLYKNLEDSVVYKEKPYYFARTNSNGEFTIKHLKDGEYKILALNDVNFNYKFDAAGEKIGYTDENVMLTDSFRQRIELFLFEEDQDMRLVGAKASQYGRVRFQLSQSPEKIRVQHLTDQRDFSAFAEIEGDSVIYWFDMRDTLPTQQFVLLADGTLRDTVSAKMPKRTEFMEAEPKLKLMFRSASAGASLGIGSDAKAKFDEAVFSDKIRDIHPKESVEIEFNHPLYEVNGKQIFLLEDSLKTPVAPSLDVAENDRRRMIVNYEWKPDMKYELLIAAEALTDIYGLTNDTIRLPYHVKKIEEYGNIDLIIDSLETDKHYLIELLTVKGETLERLTATSGETFEYRFELLETEKYVVRVIEDDNKNGKWDSGNYLQRQKPEKIYTKSVTEMRPDWDVEVVMSLKEAPKQSRGKLGRSDKNESNGDSAPKTDDRFLQSKIHRKSISSHLHSIKPKLLNIFLPNNTEKFKRTRIFGFYTQLVFSSERK